VGVGCGHVGGSSVVHDPGYGGGHGGDEGVAGGTGVALGSRDGCGCRFVGGGSRAVFWASDGSAPMLGLTHGFVHKTRGSTMWAGAGASGEVCGGAQAIWK